MRKVLLLIALTTPLRATEVDLSFAHAEETAASATVELEVVSRSGTFVLEAPVPGRTRVSFDPGSHQFRSGSSDWWIPDTTIEVTRDRSQRKHAFIVWPSSSLGFFAVDERDQPLADVTVEIRSPDGAFPRSIARCTLENENGRRRCTVPRTTVDLRIASPGRIPFYRFGFVAPSSSKTDLGTIRMQKGSSVSGKVVAPDSAAGSRRSVIVTRLSPFASPEENQDWHRTFVSDDDGHFQFTGLSPGRYKAEISEADLVSRALIFDVLADAETRLLEDLVAFPRASLSISIEPPLSPISGSEWTVALLDPASPSRGKPIVESRASEGRAASIGPLPAVPLELVLGDDDRNILWRELVTPRAGEDTELTVYIPLIDLTGTIRIGERPLEAEITIQSKQFRFRTRTDPDGTFELRAPSSLEDDVRISVASNSGVSRSMIPAVIHSADGTRELKVELPATSIRGKVVDSNGSLVERSLITATDPLSPDLILQTTVDSEGYFQLIGVDDGSYAVRADNGSSESEAVPVLLEDGRSEPEEVLLTLKPKLRLEGLVEGPAGPVARASVLIMPVGLPMSTTAFNLTDESGTFVEPLPPGARDLDLVVFAPGHAVYMTRVVYRENARLRIPLSNVGGNIEVRVDGLDDPVTATSGRQPFLLHRGASLPLSVFSSGRWRTRVQLTDGELTTIVPMVETGQYIVCMGIYGLDVPRSPVSGCDSADLPAHGSITLELSAAAGN